MWMGWVGVGLISEISAANVVNCHLGHFCLCCCRFTLDDNAILSCPVTCFDGSNDLHDQDGTWYLLQLQPPHSAITARTCFIDISF